MRLAAVAAAVEGGVAVEEGAAEEAAVVAAVEGAVVEQEGGGYS